MDEPTNDLDVETLELLEELLLEYKGTLLLVSHDRAFLNNVVTSTLFFEGNGQVDEYFGDYNDLLRQKSVTHKNIKEKPVEKKSKTKIEHNKSKKLSYKDQRELEELPKLIDSLDKEQEQLTNAMAKADFFQQDKDVIAQATTRLAEVEKELEAAYKRWEILEEN